jgi:hypothetical protein
LKTDFTYFQDIVQNLTKADACVYAPEFVDLVLNWPPRELPKQTSFIFWSTDKELVGMQVTLTYPFSPWRAGFIYPYDDRVLGIAEFAKEYMQDFYRKKKCET